MELMSIPGNIIWCMFIFTMMWIVLAALVTYLLRLGGADEENWLLAKGMLVTFYVVPGMFVVFGAWRRAVVVNGNLLDVAVECGKSIY